MQYVGNCFNSFTLDRGNSLVAELPWSNVTEFAHDVEYKTSLLSRDEFVEKTGISPELYSLNSEVMKINEVYCIYDLDRDIHYFFV